MKKVLMLVVVLFITMGFSDGNPDYLYKDDGSVVPYSNTKKVSSYQRLKQKYEAEEAYSEELKERILVLQEVIDNKNKDLELCLSQEPLIIEQEDNYFLALVGFISGFIVGVIL